MALDFESLFYINLYSSDFNFFHLDFKSEQKSDSDFNLYFI